MLLFIILALHGAPLVSNKQQVTRKAGALSRRPLWGLPSPSFGYMNDPGLSAWGLLHRILLAKWNTLFYSLSYETNKV